MVDDRLEPAVRGEQRRAPPAVRVVVLDAERAARAQQRRGPGDHRPDHRQTVRAAEDRVRRVVPATSGGTAVPSGTYGGLQSSTSTRPASSASSARVGDVRRHHLDRPVPGGGPLRRVAAQPGAAPPATAPPRTTRPAGSSLGDRQGDRPRAAAQVDHQPAPSRPRPRDPPAGEQLGLGPRHEDARADRQLQIPEAARAGRYCNGSRAGPPRDQLVEPVELRRR